MKVALREAEGDPQLVAAIMHNLAVVNYCQITDHNDRIINGEEKDDEMLETLDQQEKAKHKAKLEQQRVKEEVERDSRIKRFRER